MKPGLLFKAYSLAGFIVHSPIGVLLLCWWIIASCSDQGATKRVQTEERSMQTDTAQAITRKNSGKQHNDTLIIDTKAAVFYQPDAQLIEKRKKEAGEENVMAGAGDYLFYMNSAYEYMNRKNLAVFDASDYRVLKFVQAGNSYSIIKLDTLPELWGVYLFEPSKKPKAADLTTIEEEYKNYFQ